MLSYASYDTVLCLSKCTETCLIRFIWFTLTFLKSNTVCHKESLNGKEACILQSRCIVRVSSSVLIGFCDIPARNRGHIDDETRPVCSNEHPWRPRFPPVKEHGLDCDFVETAHDAMRVIEFLMSYKVRGTNYPTGTNTNLISSHQVILYDFSSRQGLFHLRFCSDRRFVVVEAVLHRIHPVVR